MSTDHVTHAPTTVAQGPAPALTREQAVAMVRAAYPAHSDVAPCAACGSERTHPALWRNGFRIAECRACAFRWVDPMPSPHVMADYYNRRTFTPYPPEVIKTKYAPSVAFTRKEVPDGQSILDVGCNHGHFAALLRDAGYNVSGADIDGEALAYASDHYGLTTYEGDLPEITFPHQFDAVTILSSLEHTPNPYAVLRAAAAALRPGGVLLISTPRGDGLIHSVSKALFGPILREWEFLGPPSHLTYFTKNSLLAMLGRAGFDADNTTFDSQERGARYQARELQRVLDDVPDAPDWVVRVYPLLRHLTGPARLLNRQDMLLCAAKTLPS